MSVDLSKPEGHEAVAPRFVVLRHGPGGELVEVGSALGSGELMAMANDGRIRADDWIRQPAGVGRRTVLATEMEQVLEVLLLPNRENSRRRFALMVPVGEGLVMENPDTISLQELVARVRQGSIGPMTPVREVGMSNMTTAGHIPELVPAFVKQGLLQPREAEAQGFFLPGSPEGSVDFDFGPLLSWAASVGMSWLAYALLNLRDLPNLAARLAASFGIAFLVTVAVRAAWASKRSAPGGPDRKKSRLALVWKALFSWAVAWILYSWL
jgi:hypothetical protein